MRHLVLTTVAVLVSGPAFAASLTQLTSTHGSTSSIVTKTCDDCSMAHSKSEELSGYKVPVLAPGTQRTEIIEINGEKKLVRTEAWFGGSPVVYISKVPDWMLAAEQAAKQPASAAVTPDAEVTIEALIENADTLPTPPQDGLDMTATTSAVTPTEAAAAKPLATDGFDLRLN